MLNGQRLKCVSQFLARVCRQQGGGAPAAARHRPRRSGCPGAERQRRRRRQRGNAGSDAISDAGGSGGTSIGAAAAGAGTCRRCPGLESGAQPTLRIGNDACHSFR
jgi:hypothetical protein